MGCWPRTHREIKGIEKVATWPDFWGQWLVPRSSEEWRGRGAVSPQVLGRCSEATKDGAPSWPLPVGGEGEARRLKAYRARRTVYTGSSGPWGLRVWRAVAATPRCLGLRRGTGRLEVYLTPTSASSAVPLPNSPTSNLEA